MDPDYEPITKDPEILLSMPLIPNHRRRHVKDFLHPITRSEIASIKQLLNIRHDQPFMRCKGKLMSRVHRLEKQGDFSHSGNDHRCEICACTRVAGQGTKGDFYGLGPSTGHYGVGWCDICQQSHSIRPSIALEQARKQYELIRRYGMVSTDVDLELRMAEEDAATAVTTTKIREERQIAVDAIADLKEMLHKEKVGDTEVAAQLRIMNQTLADAVESGAINAEVVADFRRDLSRLILAHSALTEYAGGKLGPISFATKHKLRMDTAKILSKLSETEVRMDEHNYLHIDELTARMPQMMSAFNRRLSQLDELKEAAHIKGDNQGIDDLPLEYVKKLAAQDIKMIWSAAKTGRK